MLTLLNIIYFMIYLASSYYIMFLKCQIIFNLVQLNFRYCFRTRGYASAFTSAADHVLNFAIASSFLPLQDSIGLHGIFLVVSMWSLFGLFYVSRKFPETEGKTLEEIEHIFSDK